ncbi:MAG: threonine--tRNA ligase [Candidatus Sungbacteria bacterium]|nr:threonine--tRNA ligase [bacterium]MDZ4285997.1 threonine--tRNA ligase [Candidatus Sungbacteria bacterium]
MNKSQEHTNIDSIRHSLAHLLAMAVLKKFPKSQLGVGPVIEHGFYYDIKLPRPISDVELGEFEKTMRELILQKLDFKGEKVSPQKARALFSAGGGSAFGGNLQPFKLDLIKEFAKDKKQLMVYRTGGFVDLCRGGHVKNTSKIDPDSFKLTKVAGAYWRGDEKNPQLTRIYGVAFATKDELAKHVAFLEEAKRRDHKKLGVELDLFTFSDLVGPGLPLWTPKGTIVRNILDSYVWKLRRERGYEQVDIPHITKKDLYEKSGHWEKFQDALFKITTREGHVFAMKPMNCPHHTQIYNRRQFSYRELPQRYASTTKVYRDEQTGELSGLSRVRAITQDDAHVFCRRSQVKEEMLKIWDIIKEFYGKAGFELMVRLSLHDPKQPKNYLGKPEVWKEAEGELRSMIKEKGVTAIEAIGEAAFYGPKIDFIAKDSLGREWQVATIQLDMNLPERFDLACINEKSERERIVMIHAAIMGSIERYLSILIEHYAGAFPFWLAPIQVAVLTVTDVAREYAAGVRDDLIVQGMRVVLDDRNETIGKKIRENEMQKVPYLLIIGGREAESKMVAVRERGKGDQGAMSIDAFVARIDTREV